jgi:hypothetical protein
VERNTAREIEGQTKTANDELVDGLRQAIDDRRKGSRRWAWTTKGGGAGSETWTVGSVRSGRWLMARPCMAAD